jgi:hypothetical protein
VGLIGFGAVAAFRHSIQQSNGFAPKGYGPFWDHCVTSGVSSVMAGMSWQGVGSAQSPAELVVAPPVLVLAMHRT